MKKLIALLLTLTCVLGLVGCATEEHENDTSSMQESIADNKDEISTDSMQESIADNKDELSTEATEDLSEIPGGTRFIIEIRDRTEEEELDCAEAVELFYEDETTEYYFNVIKSHYIIVTYNNGNSEDIVTALNAGRATIADLDEFGIEYHTEPKQ